MSKSMSKLGVALDKPKRGRDLTGLTFGRLTVIEFSGYSAHRELMWRCECACGTLLAVRGGELTRTDRPTHSCGCIRAELNRTRAITHGRTKERIFSVWAAMIVRCYSVNNRRYSHYGGRGIAVHDAWRTDFQSFYDYVSTLPNYGIEAYTLDRIKNDGNYEPDNLRWATSIEQQRNKHTNILLTYDGATRCLQEWADIFGINRSTLKSRIVSGWDVHRALRTPAREMDRSK